MPSYILRNINPKLWKDAKVRAAQDGISLKSAILWFLAQYGSGAIVVPPAGYGLIERAPGPKAGTR